MSNILRRDYFAGLAMQTLVEHYLKSNSQNMITSTTLENITVKAWQIATEMDNPSIKKDV